MTPNPTADADLTARFQAGDRAALDELVARYRRFARARSRAYFVAGGDADDLEQEALIALVKAAGDHRPEDGPFRPFADLCITRGLVSAIRRANRHKHRVLTRRGLALGGTGAGHGRGRRPLAPPGPRSPGPRGPRGGGGPRPRPSAPRWGGCSHRSSDRCSR